MDKEKNRTYDYIRLGKRIQARRKEIGLTQEELAEKIDCSLTHLSRMESGSPPGLDTLIRLCYLLGYSLDEMVGLYPSPSPYVHEVCDLFLVHTEDEQKFALWLMQYFFYVLDQKELDYKFRKKRTKSAEIAVNHLMEVLPNTRPEEFIKQFTDAFSDLPPQPKRRRQKKDTLSDASFQTSSDTAPEARKKTPYSPPDAPPLLASEDSITDPLN